MSLQGIASNLFNAAESLWEYNGGNDCDEVVENAVQDLRFRVRLRRELLAAAKKLLKGPQDWKQLNHWKRKFLLFLGFVFGRVDRSERRLPLRQLQAHTLMFCAFSHSIPKLKSLPKSSFNFLVANLESFLRVHNLNPSLYQYRGILTACHFTMEDQDSFERFRQDFTPPPGPLYALPSLVEVVLATREHDLHNTKVKLAPKPQNRQNVKAKLALRQQNPPNHDGKANDDQTPATTRNEPSTSGNEKLLKKPENEEIGTVSQDSLPSFPNA